MPRLMVALALASFSFVASAADKPLPVTVTNPVLPVEVSNANPIAVVDAKQRQQFDVYVEFSAGACSVNCFNFDKLGHAIIFDLAPVPTGKRWIITRVSGALPFASPEIAFGFQSSRIFSMQNVKAGFFGPFFSVGGALQGFSTEVLTSYGPGEAPHLRMSSSSDLTAYVAFVTVSGYLVESP